MPEEDTVTVLPSLNWGATERRGRNAASHARTEGPTLERSGSGTLKRMLHQQDLRYYRTSELPTSDRERPWGKPDDLSGIAVSLPQATGARQARYRSMMDEG